MAGSRGAKGAAKGDIVITFGQDGKIKKVEYDDIVISKPAVNLKKNPFKNRYLTEIVNFHLLKFVDTDTGEERWCPHAGNCNVYCH
jgi:hypothetical protein